MKITRESGTFAPFFLLFWFNFLCVPAHWFNRGQRTTNPTKSSNSNESSHWHSLKSINLSQLELHFDFWLSMDNWKRRYSAMTCVKCWLLSLTFQLTIQLTIQSCSMNRPIWSNQNQFNWPNYWNLSNFYLIKLLKSADESWWEPINK